MLLVTIVISHLGYFLNNLYKAKYIYSMYAFIWLLTIPTIIGIYRWNLSDMIRDIVPLFYLFLPLFLIHWCRNSTKYNYSEYIFPLTIVVAGGSFALRYFISGDIGLEDLGQGTFLVNLKYYSYDPSVTFTMIYALLMGISIVHSNSSHRYIKAVVLIGAALITFGSLGGIGQRAPLGIAALILIAYLYRSLKRSFVKLVASFILIIVIFLLFKETFMAIFSVLIEKTEVVGVNGKVAEFDIILSTLSNSWMDILFGLGWGAVYYNPVIGAVIRFSHSIIGFYLLKTGIIGFYILMLYMYWLARMYIKILIYAWRYDVNKLPLIFAIGSAPMIAMFQPTYKTLSFGLIMTMIPMLYYAMRDQIFVLNMTYDREGKSGHSDFLFAQIPKAG